MDLSLTETERDLAGLCRDFAQKEIAHRAPAAWEDARCPTDLLREMGELGLLGMLVPEEWGGIGMTTVGFGIRVNCVCPGTFRSAIHDALPEQAIDAIASRHPLGLGSADDLVGTYAHLASDASRRTTSSAVVVEGGYAAP